MKMKKWEQNNDETMRKFQKCKNLLRDKVLDKGNVELDVQILLKWLWAMHYVNDGRILLGDEAENL